MSKNQWVIVGQKKSKPRTERMDLLCERNGYSLGYIGGDPTSLYCPMYVQNRDESSKR